MSFVERKIIRVELEYCSIKFSSTNVVNIGDKNDIGPQWTGRVVPINSRRIRVVFTGNVNNMLGDCEMSNYAKKKFIFFAPCPLQRPFL